LSLHIHRSRLLRPAERWLRVGHGGRTLPTDSRRYSRPQHDAQSSPSGGMMRETRTRRSVILIGAGLLMMIIVQVLPFYVALTTAGKPKSDLSPQWSPPTGIYLDNCGER